MTIYKWKITYKNLAVSLTFLGKKCFIKIKEKNRQLGENDYCTVLIIPSAQLYSTNFELRFFKSSNPACGLLGVCIGENL